ncbi:protein FAM170A [Lagenorhynchus albirostris]|uniref:protein FAM170A n=1 Tax=Lagenorhynchus albirostris TaxID=27610 RepID=UPI0028ED6B93|nr:protein FAM170A [Lagenorhynchus albirostris]
MKQRQKRKHLENEESQETAEKGGGILKSQEDPPPLGSTVVAQGCSPGSGEVSSASEYFSYAASPRKLICSEIQRLHRDTAQPRAPLAQVQEQGETTPPSQYVSFSSSSSYEDSLYTDEEERGMKIFYMRVQVNKGVAVSWMIEKPLELLEKQLRREEVTLPEHVWVGNAISHVSTRNLSDSEPTGEENECEERAEPDSPSGSPAVKETPRAKTPDWLVTMEMGFRCMACCRVFPTLEILQQHVQYSVQDGFSCHVFHLAMSQLTDNVESESTSEEEKEEQEGKENEGQQPTGEDLCPRSRCPVYVFHSPKDRNN